MASAKSGVITKFFVWAIIAMLIVGLGGFGLSNFGGSSQAVVTTGNRTVTVQEYYNAIRQELNQFSAATQQPATLVSANEVFTQAYGQTLDQRVLERLTLEAALDNEAANMGISVGDLQVQEQLVATGAFQGLDGTFDEDAYKGTLARNNLNPRDYEAGIRDEIARTLVQAAMVSGINASDAQVDLMLSYAAQRRDVTWIRLETADLPNPLPTPTEAQLTTYHAENAERDFTAPRTKEISYLHLSPSMLSGTLAVDDASLRELYDSRAEEYIIPERRLLERLVFGTQEEADAASARLTAGEISFDDLVIERGLSLSDVDLGDLPATELEAAAADAIFALTTPGVTDVLPSKFGPAIFRMNGTLAGEITSFESVRDALQQDIAQERARRQLEDESTHIDDLLAGGATLEEVAEETDMVLATISWSEGTGDGIAAYSNFSDAARAVTEDDFPEVDTLFDGGLFALRLDGFTEPFVRPLDEIRNIVIAGWERQETDKQLTELANTYAAQMALGASAQDLGLTENRDENLTRRSFIDGAPEDLVATLFEMEPGAYETLSAFGATFLVNLKEIKGPDMADPDTTALADALRTGLSQSIAQDAYAAWAMDRLNAAGTTRNQAAISGILTQIP
ncbi:SurA N-terminal domain-containing protein [Halocynthiibacter namhaensis]|uniref:SurA N-terminal domain-containing protein n=1 Tax=Halocynthiibacter namhaensis TaxID=1290553 RepID=UPI0005790DA7|nr:SurA N-terminal domain-containing protein [Halocynthiibacter namhaensis]